MMTSQVQTSRMIVNGIEMEDCFRSRGGELTVDGIGIREIARLHGTPAYIYSANAIRQRFSRLTNALSGFASVYYSIKANPHIDVVRCLVKAGAGLEIASRGEYRRAIEAGGDRGRILFAGPGKRPAEIQETLAGGIGEIHLECADEAHVVSRTARELGIRAAVSIRVNPSARVQGGAMRMGGEASAFGFDEESLSEVVALVDGLPNLDLRGLHVYSGTQILSAATLETQWRHSLDLVRRVSAMLGRPLSSLDLGGGLGIPYHTGDAVLTFDEITDVAKRLDDERVRDPALCDLEIIVEPGRYLVGPAGIYLAGVTTVKMSRGKRFVVIDGGMHHHLAASGNLGQVIKRDYPMLAVTRLDDAKNLDCQVVGPLCTPLDTLGRKTPLPLLEAGDLIAIFQSGAYGPSASPAGFLSHDPPAEVLLDHSQEA